MGNGSENDVGSPNISDKHFIYQWIQILPSNDNFNESEPLFEPLETPP